MNEALDWQAGRITVLSNKVKTLELAWEASAKALRRLTDANAALTERVEALEQGARERHDEQVTARRAKQYTAEREARG